MTSEFMSSLGNLRKTRSNEVIEGKLPNAVKSDEILNDRFK
jgi:hypothetical protein